MSTDLHCRDGRDPHDVLGVPRGADRQQVIRAFHRRARNGGHPDAGGSAREFDEIVRARDALLDPACRASFAPGGRTAQGGTASPFEPSPAGSRTTQADSEPRPTGSRTTQADSQPWPTGSRTTQANGLALVTALLALLGPVLWPVAIVVGHFALRRIKRTGQGGGTLVRVILFLLYVLTLYVLVPFLSLLLVP